MYKKKYNDSRSGMALVVVLGLITLLIISSVTFAILMRVERAGAANARNTIMARQAVKSALNYAMASIDKNIGTNSYPVWWNTNNTAYPYSRTWKRVEREDLDARDLRRLNSDNKYFDGKKPRYVNFWNDTFGSIDANVTDSDYTAPAYIMNYSLEQYLPKGLRHRAYAKTYQGAPDNEVNDIGPEWVAMTSDEGGTDVIGRYAFLAFNTTGYLDISAMAGLQQGNSGNVKRWLGESVEELKVHPKFFNVATTAAAEQKMDKLKGYVFENVGDVVNSRATSKGADFADESAYRTISANLPGIIQDDTGTKQAFNLSPKNDDGEPRTGDDLAEYYRNNKNKIIEAFYDSGLTKSSEAFDDAKGDFLPDPDIDDKYEIDEDKYSEQALWAYLGLVDYVDENDFPEGLEELDDEYYFMTKFARPATESMALFNGFMGTVRFIRTEGYMPVTIEKIDENTGQVVDTKTVLVYDKDHFTYSMVVNGKIVFANRFANVRDNINDHILSDCIDGRLGFKFEFEGEYGGQIEQGLLDDKKSQLTGEDILTYDKAKNIKLYGVNDGDGILFGNAKTIVFDESSVIQVGFAVSNKFAYADGAINADLNDAGRAEDFENKAAGLPKWIALGAIGRTLGAEAEDEESVDIDPDAEDVIKRAIPSSIEENYFNELVDEINKFTLCATRDLGKENSEDDLLGWVRNGSGIKVYKTKPTYDQVAAGLEEDQEIQRWESGLVLSGELIDPAMAHIGNDKGYMSDDTSPFPHMAVASSQYSNKMKNDELVYADFDFEPETDIGSFCDLDVKEEDNDSLDAFKEFEKEFLAEKHYLGEYFVASEDDDEFRRGYSAFQSRLLGGKNYFIDNEIVVDGIHTVKDKCDNFESIWSSLYVKSGNQDIEETADNSYIRSVGELGFLPTGIYSTIRLFGYSDDKSDDDSDWEFNKLSDGTLYHTVLDNFTTIDGVEYGKINPNTIDIYALASVFNRAPKLMCSDEPPVLKNKELISEDEAIELAENFIKSLKTTNKDKPMTQLSDLGKFFESDPLKDIFETDNEREAFLASVCGLFSVRGQTFTILLRGEAFSPLFGRTEVRDGLGTTLATRSAVAQVWRDTVPDENGKYPMVLQFFKILDE